MTKLSMNYPAKRFHVTILIIGLFLFIPLYTYILWLLKSMDIDFIEFTKVWISFDIDRFQEFFYQIAKQGNRQTLIFCYYLNIASVIGYMFIFYSLTLMIARKISPGSRLHMVSLIFPVIVLVVAFLDLLSNFTLIIALSHLEKMSQWHISIISSTYVCRLLLFCLVISWIVVSAVLSTFHKTRGRFSCLDMTQY